MVILNGAPRSGKSALARAIQHHVPGTWINWGVDAFNLSLPSNLLPGIGLRPGGERPDLEPAVRQLYASYFAALVALSRSGLDVVADLGLHADYAEPFEPMDLLHPHLSSLDLLLVGILCPIETIMARRNADPQNGFYAAGPGIPPPVARWQRAVHEDKRYDLTLDMGTLTPEQGATAIARALAKNP